ncbi:peptidylprolyl isomerase [Prevotella sp. E13-17]|uniref:peptidylprolyl isomerase n=1 Tax=Prevotella sp. E13-17 TaxID=2913616 RepID=UPI001EDB25E3|nr:peptidylprolyl isomerase [Prevotella sp. E13-17]UKK50494.1 peptidylprolyl isomerase [Prevotella sp. E13-17]
MKLKMLFAALLMSGATFAQTTDDPVIMTINGEPVLRSEYEYFFNKNNSEGVIDKKTVEEYVDLFVNYKLQVAAALDAKIDTLKSYNDEFRQYRDQQIRPLLVTDDDMEREAHKIYDDAAKRIGPDGLIQTAHILIRANQQASQAEWDAAKVRIDSIYKALKGGADFAELAKQVSQDPGSARQGGLLPFVQRGQLVKEYEDAAYALQPGEMSGVVQSPFGYHIILMKERKQFEPFEFHRDNILRFMEQRNMRDNIASQKIDSLVAANPKGLTKEQMMDEKSDEFAAKDMELKYLIREYHDGLLLYEIKNMNVWDKGAKDEKGLARYFKKHKKNYAWDEPRFKGMAYHVKDEADIKAVKDCVKKLDFNKWADKLRTTFNADSVLRIRVEKGIFKKGDNALVDSVVFKKDTTVTKVKDYPFDAVYGKILKKGPETYQDVRGQVVSDYQEQLEKEWIAQLRRKYTFKVNEEVLKTVNKH